MPLIPGVAGPAAVLTPDMLRRAMLAVSRPFRPDPAWVPVKTIYDYTWALPLPGDETDG